LATGKLAPLRPMMEGDSYRTGMSQLNWSRGKRLMDAIKSHNASNNKSVYKDEPDWKQDSYLLPMAFPEGSPMHPSYGAGHATVAGACVTILKAYFDHGWTPSEWLDVDDKTGAIKGALAYEASNDGESLIPLRLNEPLTIEGELNKLAANIAIGRNWAGVHYYTDYIESIRMGEQIALGLLEEQKLTYPENFTMTVPLFDGGAVRI
ncbi:MAG: vanadium-dependent haloperoxidase, partial [Planctomycetota bacterium]